MKIFYPALCAAILSLLAGSLYAQHPEMSTYNGAESCYTCHSGALHFDAKEKAMEIMQTVHYKFKGWGQNVYDGEGNHLVNEENGKWTRYCGLPGSVVSINWLGNFFEGTVPGGCSRCHISDASMNPDQGAANPDEAWKRIDCMLCHASTYVVNGVTIDAAGKRLAYTNNDGKKVLPYPSGDDLKTSSKSIREVPSAEACSRCHSYNGGGYTFKRGLDYLVDDLHYDKGLTCSNCHETDSHKIALSRPDPALVGRDEMNENDLAKNACTRCHTTEPHQEGSSAARLNAHVATIDCATCHVPFHKGMTNKRFDIPVKVMSGDKFKQWSFQLDFLEPTRPSYKWFNGTVDHEHVKPLGSRGDGKITPFKLTRAYVPVDKATGIMIPLKLGLVFGSPESSTIEEMEAKIDLSVRTGAKLTAARFGFPLDNDGNYTAEYEWEWDDMWGNPGHGVVKDGLICADCHTASSIMPFEDLGYSEEQAGTLRSIVTSTGEVKGSLHFAIGQTFPNPAAGETAVSFTLPRSGNVTLEIYDNSGRRVQSLLQQTQYGAGTHSLRFDASSLQDGVYFYVINAGGQRLSKKMVVMN
ncbi:T9SS type A sorting domain-containing protein [bacterium]|nr:T9SS type A sorting domain-containing protein [bacterium]